MSYVITQACCNDATCVPVCPVNCIHPTPDEPGYLTAEMLYIDPQVCIECGVCMDVCPVEAIAPDYELEAHHEPFIQINAQFYRDPKHRGYPQQPARRTPRAPAAVVTDVPLRVAVVGSGPAACYTVEELTTRLGPAVEVNLFERLPVPGGLVRYGVAPDHQSTKKVAEGFGRVLRRPGVSVHLDVEIGTDIAHDELLAHHHAVVYAIGAPDDRPMRIPGEDLAGSHSAAEFVAWYNGHPDLADREFDFSGERAVVIGNGNVALDVARVLAGDVDRLRRTDIAAHALEQLAESRVREIVVIGRRGPAQASFTIAELVGLRSVPGVHVLARSDELDLDPVTLELHRGREYDMTLYKVELLRELATATASAGRSIELRFLASPREILGPDRVTGVRLTRNEIVLEDGAAAVRATDAVETVECGLLLRSVGYRGRQLAGLPFDRVRGVLPNQGGRVTDDRLDPPVPQIGVYATGWAKRGPSGVIGTNRRCAGETVTALLDDFAAGVLRPPAAGQDSLARLLATAGATGLAAWRAIDERERQLGREARRPRVKLVTREQMHSAVRPPA